MIDLFVILTLGAPTDTAQWQKALTASHAPVRLQAGVELASHSGLLPATLGGSQSGFYLLFPAISELEAAYPAVRAKSFKGAKVFSLSFTHFSECASAFYAAAALVTGYKGVAFEPQSGSFLSAGDLKLGADQCAAGAKQND